MEGKEESQLLAIGPLSCYWIQSHSKFYVCSLQTDVSLMHNDAQPSVIQLFLIMPRYDMGLSENRVPPATPWFKTSFFKVYRYTTFPDKPIYHMVGYLPMISPLYSCIQQYGAFLKWRIPKSP